MHLIFSAAGLQLARPRSAPEDVWVLIGDGAYAVPQLPSARPGEPRVLAVTADLALRGVGARTDVERLEPVDDQGLVTLIANSASTASWR